MMATTTISILKRPIPNNICNKLPKGATVIHFQQMANCDLPQIQEAENYPILMATLQTSKYKMDTKSFQARCEVKNMDNLLLFSGETHHKTKCKTMAMDGWRQPLKAVHHLDKNSVCMPG